VLKKNRKKSLIIILLYKKTSISSTKVVTFAKYIEVVIKEEGSKIVIITTLAELVLSPRDLLTALGLSEITHKDLLSCHLLFLLYLLF
jgi:hypothetical protein